MSYCKAKIRDGFTGELQALYEVSKAVNGDEVGEFEYWLHGYFGHINLDAINVIGSEHDILVGKQKAIKYIYQMKHIDGMADFPTEAVNHRIKRKVVEIMADEDYPIIKDMNIIIWMLDMQRDSSIYNLLTGIHKICKENQWVLYP